MAETFELEGKVVGLEQKRYRDGRGPIPGFWTVKLQTDSGERSCSFNSDRRKRLRDPQSEREPHPDFAIIQQAQVTGEAIRIRGHITYKGEGEDRRGFKNGTSAELASVTQTVEPPATSGSGSTGAPPEDATPPSVTDSNLDDAKWAVENVLGQMEIEGPLEENDSAKVKEGAKRLVQSTHEVARELSEPPETGEESAADRDELGEKRRSKGIA